MSPAVLSADQVRLLSRLLDEKKIARQAAAIPRRRDGLADIPLSFAQQRIWFVHRLQPASTLYNGAGVARLRGHLDVAVVRRCVNETIRRHEILRTTYKLVGGRPVQRVEAPVTVALPVTDLTHLPPSARTAAAVVCQNRLINQPFDLEREPPFRAELLRIAPQEHWLVLVLHHIAGDGWSLGVFHREMAALYTAYLYGQPSPLPELSLQYGDFALWQREGLSGDAGNGELDYWRERLEGAALLELPTVRPRQAGGVQDGSAAPFELTPGLVQRLSALGESERSTLYMVLLAATAVVFSRWSGQQDVVVGTPIANRNRLDLEHLIGCFVNTLPLRLDTSGNPSFRALLRQARQVCLGAYAHQDAPFERIVESVNPERGIGGETPLVRHMLGLDNAPRPKISLPDLDVRFDVMRPEKARFDIEWVLHQKDGGLSGRVWFATDLLDQASITRLLASVRTVLMAAAADPDQLVSRLPILAESERAQLLERFSGAAPGEPEAIRPPDELSAAADRLAANLRPQRAHLLGYSTWMRDVLGLRSGEVALYLDPRSRDAGRLEPLAAELLGARAATPDQAGSADGSCLATLVSAERPSIVTCTPSQLAALLASGRAAGLIPRHLLLGGEQPWPALVAECGRVLPDTCVWSLYRCGGLPVLAGRLPGDSPGVRLAGRPVAGAVLCVLDSHAELAPIGVTGELCVAGSVAAHGLEPVASPCLPGKTLFRTGDRARWLPTGVLEVFGQAGSASATGRLPAAEVREALLGHPVVDRAEVTAGLAAHVSLRREAAARRDLRTLFEERYARRSVDDDPALNPATWTSPVTGTRFSADDLRDWSKSTVSRALALQPRRMLEIGCRNGLLLSRLAPHCESYVATDLSARALRHIRESKDWIVGRADAIQLLRLAPDDLDTLPPDSVDLVLVSSIVQYSPGPDYLEQVITAAARVAKPPAAILVSDVRSLPLLPALHVFAACQSASTMPLAELRRLVADKVDGDDELAIDPAWFAQVAAHLPGITGVTVLARSASAQELAGYRYDVLLWVGERDTQTVRWADQAACELTTAQAGSLLGEHAPEPVGIRDVPDEPIRIAARATQLLGESMAATAGELWGCARAEVTSAITLAGLRSAAARSGYDTVLAGPAASGTPGLFDVVMSQAPAAGEAAWLPRLGPALAGPLGYVNDAGYAARARAAVPLLQGYLRERLPPAMIPELAVRRTWPIGQSGILDPDRLPQPSVAVHQIPGQRSPETDTERAIEKIWADVLGLDQVGVDDDFFALGGHSLMAVEVADRVRDVLGLELPLGQLFDNPTVSSVARYLTTSASDGAATPAIGRVDRRNYRKRATETNGKD
jgi:non-ribosomal peptide synthetase component F/SAM-dependent methyltransferase/acyl carrier protein